MARTVRDQDLADVGWLRSVVPKKISRPQLLKIVDKFDEWLGRRFLFERAFLEHDLSTIRDALGNLFDESLDITMRLEHVIRSGALTPLRISTLSLLLYWRTPEKYPPFNQRTKRFLKDFRLKARGVSNSSPATYKRWLAYAEELSVELFLPTPGHIDRVAWKYTERMKL